MNPDQLLEHFDRISEAPDAIQRLRRFILDLAVRGKLVEQDPNDEPAAELLKRVHAARNLLDCNGKIRKQIQQSTTRDDTSLRLPSTWKYVQLSEIIYLRSGIAIEHGDDLPDGDLPYVKVSDLNISGNSSGIYTSSRFIDNKYANSIIECGSILFPKRGGAIATNRKRITYVEVVCDSNLMAMRPFLQDIIGFLQLWFSGFDLWQLNSGTSVPQINNKDIYPLLIPLPPLAEQHRIVAKVDELMMLCDKLEAAKAEREKNRDRLVSVSLQRLNQPSDDEDIFRDDARFIFDNLPRLTTRPAHIKQLRQTILNLAVRGKLVPQDPNNEPISLTIKSITINHSAKIFELDSEMSKSFSLSRGWALVKGDIVADFVDPQPSHRTPPEYPNGIPYIGYSDISNDSKINFENARKVSPEILREHNQRYVLKKGNFIIGKIGTIGQPFFLPEPFDYTLSANIILVQPNSKIVSPAYLVAFFRSPIAENALRQQQTDSTHAVFGIKKAREFLIPLPPLAEQHCIVAKVDELMAICDKLGSQLTITEADNRRLLEAVLHEALSPALAEV
jgi:type I restriction enzyme, S subunit